MFKGMGTRARSPRPMFAVSVALALFALFATFGMGASAAPKTFDPHCNGNQADKKGGCVPDETSPVVTDVVITTGNGNGNDNGNGNGNGNDGTNPDCNTNGPERACGEEDGDHNQGGKCDGNEGNHKKPCPTATPGPSPTPGSSPTPAPDPSIMLEKSGPAEVHPGDVFSYTLKVTNTGDVDLDAVTLADALLNLDVDLPDLPAGESVTVTVESLAPTESGDVVNTAEACGTAGTETCDTDDHTLVVVDPGIEVVKTANPDSANPGQTVTFTYVVTNTGTSGLTNVTVVDDVLGDIGTAATLAAGESVTFTKEMVVAADSPTANVATACGTDSIGEETCDVAVEEITIVLPAGPEGRDDGGTLPTTGFSLLAWIASAVTSVAGGLAMVDVRRRRKI